MIDSLTLMSPPEESGTQGLFIAHVTPLNDLPFLSPLPPPNNHSEQPQESRSRQMKVEICQKLSTCRDICEYQLLRLLHSHLPSVASNKVSLAQEVSSLCLPSLQLNWKIALSRLQSNSSHSQLWEDVQPDALEKK
jgi:hypothetical protein